MKDRCMRFRAVLLAALIVLGTALLAGPVSARADALPSTDAETAASGQPSREPNEPAPDGTIYNTVQHFLYHVASRDPYSFYSTIPCTGELRECIGYLLDAWQSQGVDFVSRFNLHPSASYPYANVRHFCAQLDAELSAGDTVDVPCGSGALTFLFQKYDTTEAAYRAGAFDLAGTLGLVTASNETYGHCWLSLGRFSPSISENDMRAWLENYYKLGDGALSGTIATGDANKVWKAYAEEGVWRVHGARWSETTHGGCIVDNIPTASTSLQNAPCYVLIPTSDAEPAIAQGDLELQLSSALPAVTNGNANYALGSASLGIYADAACTKQLATAVTDAEGRAKVHHLASQTVYVKLKTTPYGYETAAAAPVRIPESGAASLTIPLTPSLIRTQISVQPQASSAPLAGAVFTIRYYACTELKYLSEAVLKGVWTVTMGADGASFGDGSTAVAAAPEGTDGYYRDAEGRIVFPLGFLAIEQTKAAEGQSLGGTWNVTGSTGSGAAPAAAVSAQEGSHAPVIYFTAAYKTLQSLATDGTTAYLVTVSPSGNVADSMKPQYRLTDNKRVTGLWFGTNTAQFIERLGLSPMMSCRLFEAGGSEKAAGSLMKTGDVVRVYDRTGALYYEGTVLIFGDVNGDGLLRMSDLIKVRNHILGTNPLTGVSLEAADCNHDTYIRMSDLIKIRNEVLGTGKIVQTP